MGKQKRDVKSLISLPKQCPVVLDPHFVLERSVSSSRRALLVLLHDQGPKLSAASWLLPLNRHLEKPVAPSLGLQLLQQGVHLTLRGFHTICPDNTRGAMAVEHEDQLLSFELQLLNLRFKVRV